MHRFEYRIGFERIYSDEQYNDTLKIEGVKTVSDSIEQLKKVPIEQCKLQYNVYACLVDYREPGSEGNVRKISKHPAWPLSHNSRTEMYREMHHYSKAVVLPMFDRDLFGAWDYLVINSDELTQEIIDYQLKELDEENG